MPRAATGRKEAERLRKRGKRRRRRRRRKRGRNGGCRPVERMVGKGEHNAM